jgi:hypothetical protein
MEAMEVMVLLHVPPGVASVNVSVCPIHTVGLPEIDDGRPETVTVVMAMHPPRL